MRLLKLRRGEFSFVVKYSRLTHIDASLWFVFFFVIFLTLFFFQFQVRHRQGRLGICAVLAAAVDNTHVKAFFSITHLDFGFDRFDFLSRFSSHNFFLDTFNRPL